MEVVETVTSLLRRLSWAQDTLLRNDSSCHSWNRWYDSGPGKPCWQRWGNGHWWLGRNQSRFKHARVYRVIVSTIQVGWSTDWMRIECGSRGILLPHHRELLEDTPTRSLLCHKVPRYQVSSDTLNRNYEACVTSFISLHHSGGQVKAVVYYRDLNWGLIKPFLRRQKVCLNYPE